MPKVCDNQLKGNYGTAVVSERLSASGCLVRPVAADTDVGVDLYCETAVPREAYLDQKEPFLHFWVQVKAGAQCRVLSSGKSASCSFDRDHLAYWKRQPVPVYAALVPGNVSGQHGPDIYIIDVTTQLLMKDLSSRRLSLTLRSDYLWPAGTGEAVSKFVARVVPDSTARLQLRKGIVTASPTSTPQYEHSIPPMPVTRFKNQILMQLRLTAAFSILFASSSAEETDEHSGFRRRLARIVAQFKDDGHWENVTAIAWSSHVDRKYDSAAKFYQRAIQIIQQDPKVCNKPAWQERVQHIGRLKEHARDHQSPDRTMLCRVLGWDL